MGQLTTPNLPASMHAATFRTTTGGLEKNISLNPDAALPPNASSLPADCTLVKVAYASPNPVDYKLPENAVFRRFLLSKAQDGSAIPCGDFAGTVVATTLKHDDMKDGGVKIGDRVFGRSDPPQGGACAEYLIVKGRENVAVLSAGVSFKDASTVGVAGLTAWQCIAPYVKEGSKVLINGGSGGTGTFGIQIAKALGCTVTTTCSGANVKLCRELGADEVIDYRSTDIISRLKETHSKSEEQFDLLIDNVDTPSIYWNSDAYLKPSGRYIAIAGSISLSSMLSMMQIMYLPSWLGGGKRASQFLLRKSDVEQYEKIAELMQEGKVKAVVEKEYSLEQTGEAFARLKSGRTVGKSVIKVGRE